MGMTYDEYWEKDPILVFDYRKANEITQQIKSNDSWLQGMYFYNAIGTVIANAFSSKGKKAETYLKEPIRVIAKTEEEIKAESDKTIDTYIAYFSNLKAKKDAEKVNTNNG